MNASQLLDISHRIEKGVVSEVKVLGKTFKIKDTKRKVLDKIYDIQFRVSFYEGEEDVKSLRKRSNYINTSHARIASLLLLNGLSYIPFVHKLHWRYIHAKYTTETISAIIEAGINDKEVGFFLKSSVYLQQLMTTRKMMLKS